MSNQKQTNDKQSQRDIMGYGFYSGKLQKYPDKQKNYNQIAKIKKNYNQKPIILKVNVNKCHQFNEYFEKKQKLQSKQELKYQNLCKTQNIYPSKLKFIKEYEFYEQRKNSIYNDRIIRSLSAQIQIFGGQSSKMTLLANNKFQTQQQKITNPIIDKTFIKRKSKKNQHRISTLNKKNTLEQSYYNNKKENQNIMNQQDQNMLSFQNIYDQKQMQISQYQFKIIQDTKKEFQKFNKQINYRKLIKSQEYQDSFQKPIQFNYIKPSFIQNNSNHKKFLSSLNQLKEKIQSQNYIQQNTQLKFNLTKYTSLTLQNINQVKNQDKKQNIKNISRVYNQNCNYLPIYNKQKININNQ